MLEIIIGYVAASIIFGGFTAGIAVAKNRDGLAWFLLGFGFNLIALIAIAVIPALPREDLTLSTPISTANKIMSATATLFLITFVGVLAWLGVH